MKIKNVYHDQIDEFYLKSLSERTVCVKIFMNVGEAR